MPDETDEQDRRPPVEDSIRERTGLSARPPLAQPGGVDTTSSSVPGQQQINARRAYYAGVCQGAADALTQWLAVPTGGDLLDVPWVTGLAAGYAFAAAQLLGHLDTPLPYAEAIQRIRDELEQITLQTADPAVADRRDASSGRALALSYVLAAIDSEDELSFPTNLFPAHAFPRRESEKGVE